MVLAVVECKLPEGQTTGWLHFVDDSDNNDHNV